MNLRKKVLALCGLATLAIFAGLGVAADGEARPIGEFLSHEDRVDGIDLARPARLSSGSVVKTHNHPGEVRLDNGRLLQLANNSTVVLEALDQGDVRVKVLSGRVSLTDATGRVLRAGALATIVVSPDPDVR